MADEYDPSVPNQHAQLLFDNWTEGHLPDLYAWLSNRNIDANVTPHDSITADYHRDHNPDPEEDE